MNDATHILIVEDLPHDYELAQREIRKVVQDCEFRRVEDEKDFLQALDDFQPHLIISDYRLPRFDGMIAMELAQKYTPSTPLIIWTGTMSEDVAVACMKKGASNYVLKENMKRLGPAVVHALEEQKVLFERRQAEDALKTERNLLRTLIDNLPDRIYVMDKQGRKTISNTADWKASGGKTMEDVIGWTDFDSYPPELAEQFWQLNKEVMDSGQPVINHEEPGRDFEGNAVSILSTRIPLRNGAGEVIGLVGIGRDITERKRAEDNLRLENERFLRFVNSNIVGIAIAGANGDIMLANDYYLGILGVTRQDFLDGKVQWTQFTPAEWLPADEKSIRQLRESGICEPYEKEYERADGSRIPVYIADAMLPGPGEQIAAFVIDISGLKQAERELRTSEERFRRLAENIEEVFWMTDADTGEEIYMSPAAEKVWGRPLDYLLHEPDAFIRTVLPEDQEIVLQALKREKDGEKMELEYRIVHPDGSIHWIWDRAFPIFGEGGHVQTLAGIAADITKRKQAEEALLKHDQHLRIGLAAANIAVFNQDLDLRYTWMYQPQLGYASNDVVGKTDAELLNAQDAAPIMDLKRHVVETGKLARAEVSVHAGDQTLHYDLIVEALLDSKGAITGITGSSLDISERKRAEIETHRHMIELQALYENGLAVGQLLEPRQIGNRIIETFARHLSWHHVAIRLLLPETDEMELIAFNQPGLGDEERAELEHRFNKMVNKVGQGLSGWVIQTGESFRTGDVRLHPQYVDTHGGIKSGLYMPLKVGDRTMGCISVESEEADAFSAQDERLLATLANQAAIAFENARLYTAAQQELFERKQAQAALWASETHYRELADSITDVLFEMDHEQRYTYWNKASEMLTGIPAEDAIGRSTDEIFGVSEEQVRIAKVYENVLESRQAKTFETETLIKGQRRAFEINVYPSTRGVTVVAKDVTERTLSEAVMKKRFELMEYSAQHSLDEVMQKTIDEICFLTNSHIGFMHFVETDEATIRLQAWSTETLRDFCTAEGQGMHYPVEQAGVWADAVRQKQPLIHNNYASLTDKKGMPEGHPQVLREMVIPIIRTEKIVAVIGVGNKTQEYTGQDLEIAKRFADYAWDTTERKQMEKALAEERNQLARRVEERTADLSLANSNLAQALHVKDQFLANMSHELRTPLNAILGLSESLGEQVAGPLNEKQQRYLTTINESGHHLLSLINDILDLAKIEAGQITLDINKIDVNSVCQASLRMIKPLAQNKNQEVVFEMGNEPGLMWADERRLKQMIVNLLSNAVKFTPENGQIGLEVHGDRPGNKVTITVWDKGIGINEHDMDRLFRPFVQLNSGLAREATGTGLGLALVAQMARLHGGGVHLTSEPGQGSRFSIELPWEPAVVTDTSIRLGNTGKFRAIHVDAKNKPTILLIEDTREVVMMLTDYLEMAGFNIVTAQDGVDGLAQAGLAHPALILMDIQMSRMDGFETTRRLRSDPEFKDTPIIALTALAMPNDRQRCLNAGMNEYMSKPVNLKRLLQMLQKFILQDKETIP